MKNSILQTKKDGGVVHSAGLMNKYLGIQELPQKTQSYIKRYLLLLSLTGFVYLLSNTFFILFAIEKVGYARASFLFSFLLLTQFILDYPSGSLGDVIGQRWVLIISFICYGIMFFLLMFVETFVFFLLIMFFNGLGNAQSSGTLNTWLDNNYRLTTEDIDSERKIYGFFQSRILTLNRVSSAMAFMVGGILATIFAREFVFGIQALATIIVIVIVFLTMKEEGKLVQSKKPEKPRYTQVLIEGVKFLFAKKSNFFFLLGTGLFFTTVTIWGGLILFPVYFGYTGDDGLAASLRTLIYINGTFLSFFTAKLSQRVSSQKLSLVTLLFIITFFPGFIFLTIIIPPLEHLNLVACVITFLMMALSPTLGDLTGLLRRRILVDLVPSDIRNSIYSLIPTINTFFGIFLVPITGLLIENVNISAGISVALFVGLVSAGCFFLAFYFKPTKD